MGPISGPTFAVPGRGRGTEKSVHRSPTKTDPPDLSYSAGRLSTWKTKKETCPKHCPAAIVLHRDCGQGTRARLISTTIAGEDIPARQCSTEHALGGSRTLLHGVGHVGFGTPLARTPVGTLPLSFPERVAIEKRLAPKPHEHLLTAHRRTASP